MDSILSLLDKTNVLPSASKSDLVFREFFVEESNSSQILEDMKATENETEGHTLTVT